MTVFGVTVPARHLEISLASGPFLVAGSPPMRAVFECGVGEDGGLLGPTLHGVDIPPLSLSREGPVRDVRIDRVIPPYPVGRTQDTGGWRVTTSDLVLQVRIDFSRIYRVEDCHGAHAPDGRRLARPFYRAEPALSLRFKCRVDREVWVRKPLYTNPHVVNPPLGGWVFDHVEIAGPDLLPAAAVPWFAQPRLLPELLPVTPCVPIPPVDPARWDRACEPLVREFALPYSGV